MHKETRVKLFAKRDDSMHITQVLCAQTEIHIVWKN